jgi:uncharacterized protein (DUF2461 family)
MAPDQLDKYRRAVSDDKTGAALVKLVSVVTKTGIEVTAHDSLKTAPKGYPKDHPRIDLLRHKGLICWRQWPVGAWLGTAKAKTRVVELLHAAGPINQWLEANVGASTIVYER